jgi:hypothetical protein
LPQRPNLSEGPAAVHQKEAKYSLKFTHQKEAKYNLEFTHQTNVLLK